MATNSSIFSGSSVAKWQVLYLVFNQMSQDTANNRTRFSYEAYIQGTGGGSANTLSGSYSITGATTRSASGQSWSWTTATKQTIAAGNFYVSHKSDGTLATQTLSVSASVPTTGGTLTASTSVSLSVATIPRYAAITAFTVSINDLTATLNWTADKTISQWRWYWGTSSSEWTNVNKNSGSASVSVSPGTAYGFQIQVKNLASGLVTTSSMVSKTATKTPSTLSLGTTSQNVGSGIKWSINKSYGYTHKITYYFGNASGYILGSDTVKSNTVSGTWNLPTELANQIPNATSGSGTIYLYTYYGGVHVGTTSRTFTATVPDNLDYRPTATISVAEGASLPSGITAFVQNQSKVKVTSTGTPKSGATIKTYSVAVAGIGTYTGSTITSDTLRNHGTVKVTLTVTDSRGFKGSASKDIYVAAYLPPQLTFTALRNETNPENIEVNFEGSISPINDQNYKYFRIRFKESDASDNSYVKATDSGQHYTFGGTQIIASDPYDPNEPYTIDPDKSYTIEMFVQDSFTSITRTFQVGTAFTLMDFHADGKAMAIGKVSEGDGFEVGMPTTIFTDKANVLKLKRSSPFSNVNLVFENDIYTRYISFKSTGRPAWSDDASVDSTGHEFWTDENNTIGSNANGRYIRFNDGTQVCYLNYLISNVPTTTSMGGMYGTTVAYTWTFPATFSAFPSVSGLCSPSAGGYTFISTSTINSNSNMGFGIISTTNSTVPVVRVGLMAVGRWK